MEKKGDEKKKELTLERQRIMPGISKSSTCLYNINSCILY